MKRFWSHLFHFSPRRFVLGCTLNILSTATSGIGLLMLIPLFQLSGWLDNDMPNGFYNNAIAHFFSSMGKNSALFTVVGFFMGMVVLFTSIDYLHHRITTRLRLDYLFSLRQKLYTWIGHSSWSHIARQPATHIEQMMSTGFGQLDALTQSSLRFLSDLVLTVGYVILSCTLSFRMTLLIVLLSGFGIWISKSKNIYKNGAHHFHIGRQLHEALSRFLDGMKFAKSTNGVPAYLAQFQELSKKSSDIQRTHLDDQQRARLILRMVSTLAGSILFLSAMLALKLPAASLITLLILYSRLMPRISSIQQSYLQMMAYVPVFDQYSAMCHTFQTHAEPTPPPQPLTLTQSLRFNQICYHHAHSSFSLGPISVQIEAHSTTAIVGPSGSGKSTVVDLILGLLKPDSGQIIIDDTILTNDYLVSWRDQISYVPQDCFLINGSVRENLCWTISIQPDDALWNVLALASASAFVLDLPQGLDTTLGDRGIRLSGGQRQRIALARALLRRPKLLILDEATSALDTPNEETIFKALQNLHGHLTMIIISHRYHTICDADQVLVINDGCLVESGSPDYLLSNTRGHFSKLFGQYPETRV